MNMLDLKKPLKNDIEANQIQLQKAICNHQSLMALLREDEKNFKQITLKIQEAEQRIINLGVIQKELLRTLRKEFGSNLKSIKNETITSSIEQRRITLTNALNRTRKQHLAPRVSLLPPDVYQSSSSSSSTSSRSPDSLVNGAHPTLPEHCTQASFLENFELCTHDVYKEMKNKRCERIKRSTANPQFVYGKGFELLGAPPRKKRSYFYPRPPSPPNTRGRKRQEMSRSKSNSPPTSTATSQTNSTKAIIVNGNHNSGPKNKIHSVTITAAPPLAPPPPPPPLPSPATLSIPQKIIVATTAPSSLSSSLTSTIASIPNLPSGLIIERITSSSSSSCSTSSSSSGTNASNSSATSSSPDSKQCIMCKQPGALITCDQCTNSFHMSCHNRPFFKMPTKCPRCLLKMSQRSNPVSLSSTSSSNSSSSSSSEHTPTSTTDTADIEVSEKLNLKQDLVEKHQNLVAELTQLQHRHSELVVSVRSQNLEKQQLQLKNIMTENKLKKLLTFIHTVRDSNFTTVKKGNS